MNTARPVEYTPHTRAPLPSQSAALAPKTSCSGRARARARSNGTASGRGIHAAAGDRTAYRTSACASAPPGPTGAPQEALLRAQQRHHGPPPGPGAVPPAADAVADRLRAREGALDQVGRSQGADQFGRQAEALAGQGLCQPLPEARGGRGIRLPEFLRSAPAGLPRPRRRRARARPAVGRAAHAAARSWAGGGERCAAGGCDTGP